MYEKLWKQRLVRLHASLGLVVSLLLYISLFFGIFAIFLPYIHVWEKPSRHIQTLSATQIDYEKILQTVALEPNFPQNNLVITLPKTKGESALKVSHRFATPLFFNSSNAEKIVDEGKTSQLSSFLNQLHYGKVLDFDKELFGALWSVFGRVLFGLMAVGVMSVIISGVILILIFSYKQKIKTPKMLFSALHVKIFTWVFPLFLLIVMSGAFMNLSLLSATPMSKLISGGAQSQIDAIIGPVLFPKEQSVAQTHKDALMLPIAKLLHIAQIRKPTIDFQQIRLINWHDQSARIEFKGYDPYKPFLNGGVFHKPSVTLSGVDGSLIAEQGVLGRSWSVYAAEATFFLHFLAGVDSISRTIVALMMLGCALAIGFGVMLWLEKEAKKFESNTLFYHGFGRLALSVMVGVLPATALLFVVQWLLPFDMTDRVLWQKGLFYNAWLATLFWSFYRLNSYQAARELLALGGVLFIVAVGVHYYRVGFVGIASVIGVNCALLFVGSVLLCIAQKLPVSCEKRVSFWLRKKEQV